jgi:hypothetical protein
VLGAFLVGWEIGTWLSEKFEVVRKAGIFMVEMLVKAVEQLQYRWEAFAAIFTSDTSDQATQRHQQRLAEMNQIFGQMYADAGRGAEAAKGAGADRESERRQHLQYAHHLRAAGGVQCCWRVGNFVMPVPKQNRDAAEAVYHVSWGGARR